MTARPTRTRPRQERQKVSARITREAREAAGLSKTDVATIQDCDRVLVVRYEDDEDKRAWTPLDLALDPTIGPHIVERLGAELGLIVSRAPAGGDPRSVRGLIPTLILAAAALQAGLHEATSPDSAGGESLTDDERSELRTLKAALDQTLATLDAALRTPQLRPLEGGKSR